MNKVGLVRLEGYRLGVTPAIIPAIISLVAAGVGVYSNIQQLELQKKQAEEIEKQRQFEREQLKTVLKYLIPFLVLVVLIVILKRRKKNESKIRRGQETG